MRRSRLGDPTKAYPRFLVSISIVLECLSCSNSLAKNRRAIILC